MKFKTRKQHRRYSPPSTPRRKRILTALIILAVIIGGALGLHKLNVINLPFLPDTKNQQDKSNAKDSINYNPPTEQELKETEQFKNNQVTDGTPTPPHSPSPEQTRESSEVIVTSWGYNAISAAAEVTGYIQKVESGGVCTLVLQKGGQTVTTTGNATVNAQSTSCGVISIERSRLSAGNWEATLSYKSATTEGSSKQVTIEVN